MVFKLIHGPRVQIPTPLPGMAGELPVSNSKARTIVLALV